MTVLRDKTLPMIWRLAGLAVFACCPAAAQAAIYKCIEEGRVVFADRPCAYVQPSAPQAVQPPQPSAGRAAGSAVPPPAELRPARR